MAEHEAPARLTYDDVAQKDLDGTKAGPPLQSSSVRSLGSVAWAVRTAVGYKPHRTTTGVDPRKLSAQDQDARRHRTRTPTMLRRSWFAAAREPCR